MKRFSIQLVILSVLCLGYCGGLFAQATSQISGTVKDASGAVVAGAGITVTQTATGVTRSATSDEGGVYALPSLPLGPYRMEVKKQGFTTYVQTGIVLEVASAPTIDPELKVGAISESVQVEASAPMIETSSTGVGQVVNSTDVVELPLNGRQVTQLITLAGASNPVQAGFGTAPNNGNLNTSKNYPNEALVSVGGGMLTGTTYLMDGGTHNDPFNNLNLPLPFPDAVQEFKVQTSALPAEYGQHSGGAVNVVTKSGGNQFHGDAFEFVRNNYFNAHDYFTTSKLHPNGVSDGLKRNQFGGTLGGPIKQNKVFFFVGYQGTLIRSQPTAHDNLPTAAMLSGDLSGYIGAGCMKTPLTGSKFFNFYSPTYHLSTPVSSLVTNMMAGFQPLLGTVTNPCGSIFFPLRQNQNEHMGVAKVDYQINSKQSIFVRYYATHVLQPSSYLASVGQASVQNAGIDDTVSSLVLGHTFLFGTNALNTVHFTYNRDGVTKFQVPIPTLTDIGVTDVYLPLPHYNNTYIGPGFGAYFGSAGAFATPGLINTHTYELKDDFSLVKGPHQFQFGVVFTRPSQTSSFCVNCDGSMQFGTTVAALGDGMADFIASQPDGYNQANITHDIENWRYMGLYAQDSWKVNSRLTLNYGLRWEPYFGGTFPNNQFSWFDMQAFLSNIHSKIYPLAPAGVFYPGDSGYGTGGRPNFTRWGNWAPRFGLAWDPTGHGKTLVRASWGMFFDMPQTLYFYPVAGELLWGSSLSPNGATFADPWAGYPTHTNPFPIVQNATTPYPASNTTFYTVPTHVKNTYVDQWNLAIQKQVGSSWLFKASYIGNDAIHLWADKELNPAIYPCPPSAPATCSNTNSTAGTNSRRLLTLLGAKNPLQTINQGPYFGGVEQLDDGATASYNGLLVSAEHRLSSHFSMLANYTWSHCISDNAPTVGLGIGYTNPANRRFDRGNCVQVDVHHNVNISGILQTPHFSSSMLQWIAGNWQMAPILGIHTGSYFTVATSDFAYNGISGQRPNQILANPYCAVKSPSCWINPAAFANPTVGTFGNAQPYGFLGPGYVDLDLSISKRFPITERQNLETRFEAFNVANHPNLLNPSATFSALATFGKITTDVAPRIMQFAIKYNF
jgi:Carboxypeptidase regulatory-like domain/TonB dependent receptor